jgi:hypothetical protein
VIRFNGLLNLLQLRFRQGALLIRVDHADGRKDEGCEDADDGNDNEKFNEGERRDAMALIQTVGSFHVISVHGG